jgi:hypothetical protein
MTAEDRVSPFSNGSQHVDWTSSNCDRCTKAYDEANQVYRCTIQEAIDRAGLIDGDVDEATAARMGITPETKGRYVWKCAEVSWTPEWQAEWRERQTRRYRVRAWMIDARRATRRRLAATYTEARRRLLWPIAEKYGNDDPDGCWAEWATWAMGYTGRPSKASGAGCKIKPGESGSCWCGKNRSPDIEEGLARQAADLEANPDA